eukprot:GHVR01113964.1.p1 GENE.GHVR01113964.1~~GHVR01113964.1.p1  ORF type:complete len:503 (+),score=40.73 GHVR01113964.1:50-1558(+)
MSTPLTWTSFKSVGIPGANPGCRAGHVLNCIPRSGFPEKSKRTDGKNVTHRVIMFGGHTCSKRNDIFILEREMSSATAPADPSVAEYEEANKMGSRKHAYPAVENTGIESWVWRNPSTKGCFPEPVSQCASFVADLSIKFDSNSNLDGPTAVIRRPYLFVIGGQGSDRRSKPQCSCLDLQTLVWRRVFVTEFPPPRDSCAAVWYMGVGWVYGGKVMPSNVVYDDMWGLDLGHANFHAHLMREMSDKQFSLAGKYTIPYCNEFEIDGALWKQVAYASPAPAPVRRHSSPIVGFGGKLWMYGGTTGGPAQQDTPLGDLWTFDCKTRHWEEVHPAGRGPGAISGHCLTLLNCATEFPPDMQESLSPPNLLLWGGLDSQKRAGDRLFVLDLESLFWSSPSVCGTPPATRKAFAFTSFSGGIMLIFGGEAVTPLHHNSAAIYGQTKLTSLAHVSVLHLRGMQMNIGSVAKDTNLSGVNFNVGCEAALRDAESVLSNHKSKVCSVHSV